MQYRHPTITERQRQREIGQVRDTHRRIGMVQVRQTGNGRSGQGRVGKGSVGCDAVQYAVTKRGDSAGEDGCLRGRDPWEPRTADSTGQVRSGQASMDAMRTRHHPEGQRWMHAYRAALTCCQPHSRATIPRIPERNMNRKHGKRRKPRIPYIHALKTLCTVA